MSDVEAPASRYQIRPLKSGVEVEVAPARRPLAILLLTLIAFGMLCGGIYFASVANIASLGACFILSGMFCLYLLFWGIFGYERLRIDDTTVTFEWQAWRIQRVRTYALKDMGRIEKRTTSYYDDTSIKSNTYWSFQLKGREMPFMATLTTDETTVFLKDIGSYLPEHIKPVDSSLK